MIIWASVNIIRMLRGFDLLNYSLYFKKNFKRFGRDISVDF